MASLKGFVAFSLVHIDLGAAADLQVLSGLQIDLVGMVDGFALTQHFWRTGPLNRDLRRSIAWNGRVAHVALRRGAFEDLAVRLNPLPL